MTFPYRLVHLAFRALAPVLTRLRIVRGLENVPAEGAVIFAGNHISYWDPTTLVTYVPRQVRFLAKAEAFRYPVLGWMLRLLEVVALERGTPDVSAMRAALDHLGDGGAVALYPRGSRAPLPGGRRHPAKGGVLLLAERSGAPVVPVAIAGMEGLFRGRPEVGIVFGEPFRFEDLRSEAGPGAGRDELLAALMDRIESLLPEGTTGGPG